MAPREYSTKDVAMPRRASGGHGARPPRACALGPGRRRVLVEEGGELLLADLRRVLADDVRDEAAHRAAHALHRRADALLELARHAPGHRPGALAAEALEGLDVPAAPLAGLRDDLEFLRVGLVEDIVEDGLELLARHGSKYRSARGSPCKGGAGRPAIAAASLRWSVMDKRRSALVCAISVSVIWGLSFLSTKVAIAALPPMTIAAARFVVAVVLLLPIALARARGPALRAPRPAPHGRERPLGRDPLLPLREQRHRPAHRLGVLARDRDDTRAHPARRARDLRDQAQGPLLRRRRSCPSRAWP